MTETSLKTEQNLLLRFCGRFSAALTIAALAGLTVASLFWRAALVDPVGMSESKEIVALWPPVHLLVLAVLLAVLLVLANRLPTRLPRRVLYGVVLGAAAVVGLLALGWSYAVVLNPQFDQLSVIQAAQALAHNDFAGYPQDSYAWQYMQSYPQQGAMALVMEPFFRVFRSHGLRFWVLFQVFCAALCVVVLCAICKAIGGSDRAVALCAVLCILFLPVPLYASFVYGTLPAPALGLLGTYGAVRLCRGGSLHWWWLPALLLPLACLVYKGSMILVFAVMLALVFTGLSGGRRGLLRLALPGVALFVLTLVVQAGAVRLFFWRSGLAYNSGIPFSGWILMGLSWPADRSPGAFDASHWKLFKEYNHDTAATAAVVAPLLRARIQALASGGAGEFFALKTAQQWLDPWFECLSMNQPAFSVSAPSALLTGLCGGTLYTAGSALLGALLSVVYGFGTVGVLQTCRRQHSAVWPQVLSITFLGGFLFQLVYESKSRYCLPYFLYLFPLAAIGLAALVEKREKASQEQKEDKLQPELV